MAVRRRASGPHPQPPALSPAVPRKRSLFRFSRFQRADARERDGLSDEQDAGGAGAGGGRGGVREGGGWGGGRVRRVGGAHEWFPPPLPPPPPFFSGRTPK